jgi:hypothetical protein
VNGELEVKEGVKWEVKREVKKDKCVVYYYVRKIS